MGCNNNIFIGARTAYFPFPIQMGDRALIAPEEWRRIPHSSKDHEGLMIDFGVKLPEGDY